MVIAAIVNLIINIIGIVPMADGGTATQGIDDEEGIMKEAETILEEIRSEYSGRFASQIQMRVDKSTNGKIRSIEYYSDNIIVDYLELGTGIYGPYKTPIKAKGHWPLAFKDVEIATALGFPTDEVHLWSVKGIKGRYAIARGVRKLQRAIGGRTYFNSDRLGNIPVPTKRGK